MYKLSVNIDHVYYLLFRWGDANSSYKENPRSKDKEMSKSLVNVKEKTKVDGSETPLMKVKGVLKILDL